MAYLMLQQARYANKQLRNVYMSKGELIAVLRSRAEAIRAVEAEALERLHEQGDTIGYEKKLREKCAIMQRLIDDAAPHLQNFDQATAAIVEDALTGFGERASQALSVGSVFFMSALLYPEDYVKGQPNDLERRIDHLATL